MCRYVERLFGQRRTNTYVSHTRVWMRRRRWSWWRTIVSPGGFGSIAAAVYSFGSDLTDAVGSHARTLGCHSLAANIAE